MRNQNFRQNPCSELNFVPEFFQFFTVKPSDILNQSRGRNILVLGLAYILLSSS